MPSRHNIDKTTAIQLQFRGPPCHNGCKNYKITFILFYLYKEIKYLLVHIIEDKAIHFIIFQKTKYQYLV